MSSTSASCSPVPRARALCSAERPFPASSTSTWPTPLPPTTNPQIPSILTPALPSASAAAATLPTFSSSSIVRSLRWCAICRPSLTLVAAGLAPILGAQPGAANHSPCSRSLAQAPWLDRALAHSPSLQLDFVGGPTFDLADDLRKFAINEMETHTIVGGIAARKPTEDELVVDRSPLVLRVVMRAGASGKQAKTVT